MLDEDQIFARCFEQGRRAATIGKCLTANPYLDVSSEELAAWTEGFASVETATFIQAERAGTFHAGEDAAIRGEPASVCPHLDDDSPERMEIWLLGYAPHVEPEQPTRPEVQRS